MKILHIISAFDVDFPGGITNYVRTLAASQVDAGNDVVVIDGGKVEWRSHPLGFKVLGSKATQGDHFVVSMKRASRKSTELMNLIVIQNPDVVHFHLTSGIGTDFYAQFGDLGMRYVVSLHDYYLFCPRVTMIDYTGNDCGGPAPTKCSNCIGALDQIDLAFRVSRKTGLRLPRVRSPKLAARNSWIEEFLQNAVAVLAVSNRVRELYESVYPRANYVVSHIGSSSASVTRPPKVPCDNLRLTFIGTLAKFKGAEILEQIARGLQRPDVTVQFFGRVGLPEDSRKISSAGVDLRGPYTSSDLPEIMSNTDIGLVLPIWEDNAPQVVMEFLNYGVPVVASNMGGIPDFVGPDNGFLFDPRSRDGVNDAIRYLDSLELHLVRKWGASLPRLTGPGAHQEEIQGIYSGTPSSIR